MMISTGLQRFLLCLVSGALIPAAQGISYRQWAAAPEPATASISILLEPVSNGCVQETQSVTPATARKHRDDTDQVPQRPLGGYLGQVVIQQRPGSRLELPLTVVFLFPEVDAEDLLPPSGQSLKIGSLKWHLPMGLLNSDAPLRMERFRRSIRLDSLPPSGHATLPLLLPSMLEKTIRNANNLFSCLCEVRDAKGNILARKHLVELFCPSIFYGQNGQNGAWVMNESEADRYLRENAGIQRMLTVAELPAVIEPYAELNALWISAEAAHAGILPPAMLRRLMLMGVWIYGRAETTSNLVTAAGLPGPGTAVLLGGIQTSVKKDSSGYHPPHSDGQTFWDDSYYPGSDKTNAMPVMNNQRDLFQPLKRWYIGWTIGVLGLFFAVACIGLPAAFWLLKGSRRLVLWWLIPAVTAAISIVSLAGGKWLLPRQPQADITEYRFAVAGWPEVYCHSVNRLLTFENREAAWKLPKESFALPTDGRSYRFAGPQRMDMTADGVIQGISGLKRGQISVDETACFRSLPLPVAIDRTTNPPRLKALVPLRHVHVWENGSWHILGTMAPGQTAEVARGIKTNEVFGIPRRICRCFPSYNNQHNPVPCKNCGKIHEGNKDMAAAFSNVWVVAALAADPAEARPVLKNVQTESRAIWFIQIPLNPKAKISDPEGKAPRDLD